MIQKIFIVNGIERMLVVEDNAMLADVLRDLALKSPPNVGDGFKTLVDAARQGLTS